MYGGTESIVDLLARGLTKAGHDVILACPEESTCPVERVSPPPIVVTHHGPFDGATLPLFRTIARRASIIAISAAQSSTGEDVPVHRVIHHGIDIDSFRSSTSGCGRCSGGTATGTPVVDREECHRSAVQRFSAERMVADHVALYQELIRNRGVSFSPVSSAGRRDATKPTMAV